VLVPCTSALSDVQPDHLLIVPGVIIAAVLWGGSTSPLRSTFRRRRLTRRRPPGRHTWLAGNKRERPPG